MRARALLLLSVAGALIAPACAHAQKGEPLLTGYVTAITPSGAIELESGRLELQPGATFSRRIGKVSVPLPSLPTAYLGEVFACYCRFDAKRNTLLVNHLAEVVPVAGAISSRGIVEAVLPETSSTLHVVRADGFLLHLSQATVLHFEDGLTLDALAANQWIAYKGQWHGDGTVDVAEATVWRNQPEAAEAKLRDQQDFKAESVDTANPQTGLSKAVLGIDPKKLAPHQDPVLQARLDRIGNALVPAYFQTLGLRDPSRIDFRFRAVDAGKLLSPIALTSGIILVPYAAIERLPQDSDDQLAALLADSMAVILEKQKYLNKEKRATLTTATLVSSAVMLTPFGLAASVAGLSGSIAAGSAKENLLTREMEQSGRVGLWLLHDAGFDLAQAPLAWWQLASPKAKPLAEIALPARTQNLYAQLGTTWHRAEPAVEITAVPLLSTASQP